MANRLNLDWKLSTREERNLFATTYLETLPNPTEDELDTIAKYILWGVNSDGLNGRQEGLDLPTRSHTWDTQTSQIESLDALLESPTFSENIIRKPEDPVFKTPKINLDRTEVREKAPTDLRENFEDLWREIDSIELETLYYELAHGKRTLPIRDSLLNRFSTEERQHFQDSASHLNLYGYLRKKHLLVDMRRQQYALKDGYSEPMLLAATFNTPVSTQIVWGEDVQIEPLGLPFNSPICAKLWRTDRFPIPSDFSEEDLRLLSSYLWSARPQSQTFNFCNVDHLTKLSNLYNDLLEAVQLGDLDFESTLPQLLEVWDTYVSLAPLKDFQRDVLDMKIKHRTNEEIVKEIESKYGKRYTLNYISTMYCKIILPCIAQTARRHREVCENLFFPENFKKCIDCGRILLRDGENFVKKARSSDGYSPRCKKCEKKIRDSRK